MKFIMVTISMLCSLNVLAKNIILDETKVIELVKLQNEQLQISQLDIKKAKIQIKVNSSRLFPTFSAQFGVQKASGEGNLFPNAYDWNKNARINLSQPLYTFGKISGGIDVASSAYKMSQHSKELTKAEIITVAKKIYFSILYAKELVTIFQESHLNARNNRNALKKRVQFGRISQNDNLKMMADIAGRLPSLIEAKKNLSLSELEMRNLLAIPEDQKIIIIGNLNNLLFNNAVKRIKVNNLASIRLLTESLRLSDIGVKLAKSQMFPTLSSFVSYSPSIYTDSMWGDKLREQKDLSIGLNLSFSWSIGGEQLKNLNIERVKKRIALLKLNIQKRDELTKYNKLAKEYESLKEKLVADKNAVSLAKSSYQVMLESFKSGVISQLRLNDSEIFYTQQKISCATTLFSLLNTRANLERLILMQGKEE